MRACYTLEGYTRGKSRPNESEFSFWAGRQERIEKATAGARDSIADIKCQSNGGGRVNVTLIHPKGWGESGPQALPVWFLHSGYSFDLDLLLSVDNSY